MANFTKGHVFTEHEAVSASSLNDLVDKAALSNVWNNTLDASAIRIPWLVDAIGSPVTGDIRVPASYLLEMFFSSQWNAQEGDVLSTTMQNNSGVNLLTGDVVCQDNTTAGGFIIPLIKDDPTTHHVAGVLLDDVAAGASGRVAYHGVVFVKPNANVSYAAGNIFTLTDNWNFEHGATYNQAVATAATPTGGGAIAPEDDRTFGMFMDSGVGSLLTRAYIWK